MTGNGVDRKSNESRDRMPAYDRTGAESDGFGPPHPLDAIFGQVRELTEYARFYVETRKDLFRAGLRSLIWKAALGVIAAIAGTTVIVVASAYLLSGIAHGLGELFGERYWLGELVTGAVVLLGLFAAAFLGIKMLTKKSRERIAKKYERRQQEQHQRFGHSASERAQQLRESHRG
jgi:cytochrome c biogenesis protein CcdA